MTGNFFKSIKGFCYNGHRTASLFFSMINPRLQSALESVHLPGTTISLASVCSVQRADAQAITLEWHIPLRSLEAELKQGLQQQLAGDVELARAPINSCLRVESYRIANAHKAPVGKQPPVRALPQVKNVIAVASGKGGVGKSTTAINLAIALQQEGARVGLLDADIFGPSQSLLSGIAANTRPEVKEQKYFVPLRAHGLQLMSMGFLMTEQTPAVWRGPMASGALTQMMTQTAWEELDYLLVDMPPGTGDIQLTLSQSCPVTAAVIITTPQDIALLDAIKGIEMFRKVDVPILGIIENMSMHICSHCGHAEALFGEGGGQRVAQDYQVPLLAQLPLDISIRQQADKGLPTVAASPDSAIASLYRQAAWRMSAALCRLDVERSIPNVISIR